MKLSQNNKKIGLLIIGSMSIGLVTWLAISRTGTAPAPMTFSTQSVGENYRAASTYLRCPRADKLWSAASMTMTSPLVDQSAELFALQQWVTAQNFNQRWPSSRADTERKWQLVRQTITRVTAQITAWRLECLYATDVTPLAQLIHSRSWDDCTVSNTADLIWFVCQD